MSVRPRVVNDMTGGRRHEHLAVGRSAAAVKRAVIGEWDWRIVRSGGRDRVDAHGGV
jgi:hypothetical protein